MQKQNGESLEMMAQTSATSFAPETLFDADQYRAGLVRSPGGAVEKNPDQSLGGAAVELSNVTAGRSIHEWASRQVGANSTLTHALESIDLRNVETREDAEMLLELALGRTIDMISAGRIDDAVRATLYLQSQDLLESWLDMDTQGTSSGAYLESAIAVAEVHGNSQDIAIARQAVERYMRFRLLDPSGRMDPSSCSQLREALLRLADCDTTPWPIERIWQAYWQETELIVAQQAGYSELDSVAMLQRVGSPVPPDQEAHHRSRERTAMTQLLTEVSLLNGRQRLVSRLTDLALDRDIDLGLVATNLAGQRALHIGEQTTTGLRLLTEEVLGSPRRLLQVVKHARTLDEEDSASA